VRKTWLVLIVGAACARGDAAPTEEPQSPPEPAQCKGDLEWSYDPGLGAAEGATNPGVVDVPCPANERIAQTKTAMFDKPKLLRKFVRFCVDVEGKTKSVEPVDPGGDAKLDEILVETVRRWTFTPAELGGQKVEACSTMMFALSFE
jgi:hypothetical protein